MSNSGLVWKVKLSSFCLSWCRFSVHESSVVHRFGVQQKSPITLHFVIFCQLINKDTWFDIRFRLLLRLIWRSELGEKLVEMSASVLCSTYRVSVINLHCFVVFITIWLHDSLAQIGSNESMSSAGYVIYSIFLLGYNLAISIEILYISIFVWQSPSTSKW